MRLPMYRKATPAPEHRVWSRRYGFKSRKPTHEGSPRAAVAVLPHTWAAWKSSN
jgi:ribosomal protein L34